MEDVKKNNLKMATKKRQENMLAKEYTHKGEIITLETFIRRRIALGHVFEINEKPKYIYNRVKYNRMDDREQRIYNEKLKLTVKSYQLCDKQNDTFFELPKLVYDYFNP